MNAPNAPKRVPVRDGLFSGMLSDLGRLSLAGSRCSSCGETSLGSKTICANCGKETVQDIALGQRGILWTYTVVRHRPPGNYKGPEPFVPFGLGLVELPEGVRVMAPIRCDIEKLRIGLPLKFKATVRPDDGREVVAFTFEPEEAEAAHV